MTKCAINWLKCPKNSTVNAVRFENDLLIGEMFDGVGLIKGQKTWYSSKKS